MQGNFYLRIPMIAVFVLAMMGFGVAYAIPPNEKIAMVSPPSNDDCSGAIDIMVTGTTCTPNPYTNVDATASGESGCGGTGDRDIWFKGTLSASNTECTVKFGNLPAGIAAVDIYDACGGALFDCFGVSSNQSYLITGLTAGATYYFRVSKPMADPQGNINICIWQPGGCSVNVVPTHTSCGLSNGSATANPSGGSGYTYNWSNGGTQQTISNLAPGTYSVTVTASGGCTATGSTVVDLSNPVTANASSTDETCNACNNGTATVSASGASSYTYLWSNGEATQSINNLAPGTYSVTVTGNNGCTATPPSVVVNKFGCPTITVTITKTNAPCFGENGTAVATVTGGMEPYTYQWSSGDTTKNISAPAGVYTVVVNDANGCGSTTSTVINQPPQLTVSTEVTAESCAFICDGTAKVIGLGGTAPYTYIWNTGQTTDMLKDLCPGAYMVTVTDVFGCQTTAQTMIDTGLIVTVEISGDTMVCFGKTGELHVPAQFDSYRWTTMGDTMILDTTNVITWFVQGSYVILVSKSGCVAQDTTYVDINSEITLSITRESNDLKAIVSGGSGGFTYFWNTGDTTEFITVSNPGTYSVTVMDEFGCDANATYDFTVGTIEVSTKPMKVHPNPVGDILTLDIPKEIELSSISIFSLTGQLVQAFPTAMTKLDVSGLVPGTYVIIFITNSGILRTKFVKI